MSTLNTSIQSLPPQIANIVSGESEPDGQALCELREHLQHLHRQLNDNARPQLAKLAQACNGLVDPLLRTGSANLDHVLIAVNSILQAIGDLHASEPAAAAEQDKSQDLSWQSNLAGRSTQPGATAPPPTPIASQTPIPSGGLSLDDHELENEFGKLLEAVRTGARNGSEQAANGEPEVEPGLQVLNRRRLGEILVSLAMINRKDLEIALHMQKVTGRRVGETLVEMSLLTPAQLENALRTQDV